MHSSFGNRMFNTLNAVFLSLLGLATIYPLWREISRSLSSGDAVMRGGMFLWPVDFRLDAYHIIIKSDYLWTAYGNSLFITIVGTVLALLLTSSTAYPLAKRTLPLKKLFMLIVLFTMIFSGGLIPTYLVMKDLHLINSLWAIIVLNLISAFNVIVMLSFIRTIPEELEESAMIDGANPIRIFFTIILPLCKPVLATLALWMAVSLWNNFFQSFIYLNDKAHMTLPVLLRQIIAGQVDAEAMGELNAASSDSVIAATIVVSLIPILMVYPFLQRFFVKGAMIGSVKG